MAKFVVELVAQASGGIAFAGCVASEPGVNGLASKRASYPPRTTNMQWL